MKECAYCGRDNEDDAVYCRECGTEEFVDPAPPVRREENLCPGDEFVLLLRCQKLPEADLVRSVLGAAEIEVWLPDEAAPQNVSLNVGSSGYVRVMVQRKNLDRARELLREDSQIQSDPGIDGLPIDEASDEDPYVLYTEIDPLEARSILKKLNEHSVRFLLDSAEQMVAGTRSMRKISYISLFIHKEDLERAVVIFSQDWKV